MNLKPHTIHAAGFSASAVIPADRVVKSHDIVQVGGRPTIKHDGPASVELISEGDVVKAIDVTCSCGQKLRLWCSYESNPEVVGR